MDGVLVPMTSNPTINSATSQLDRRTRKRRERRDHVFHTAMELFVQRGYDNTTMDDIGQRADVARATVFNHFQRKSAFIDEWASRRREQAAASLRAKHLEGHPTRHVLARYMRELAKTSAQTRAETVALMTAAVHSTNILANPALGHDLANYIAHGQRHGEIRSTINPEQGGLIIATSYFAILTHWIDQEPEPFNLCDELLKALDLILDGMTS